MARVFKDVEQRIKHIASQLSDVLDYVDEIELDERRSSNTVSRAATIRWELTQASRHIARACDEASA